MKVSEYAVKHPAVIGMLLIVLIVFGLLSVSTMNVEFMSDVSMPSVMVISVYPGASAEDMEEDVTSVLEDDFITLPDFKSVSSESSNSVSVVTITFRDGVDPYDRVTEVRDRINKLREELPDGLSGIPEVLVGGAEMLSVFSFAVNGGSDTGTVTDYIENTLRPRLTAIKGVSSVNFSGGRNLRMNVKLRLDDLSACTVSAATVYQILNHANVSLPAGTATYQGKDIAVRYGGELSSLQDIKDLPVGVSADAAVIRLSDVADITLGYPEATSYVTDGEQPAIIVDIKKRSDGNTMDIAKQVKRILAESTAETGGALSYRIIGDDSRTVSASLKTVIESGLGGIVMAVIVIFLFLSDARSTLIIGLSIPLSILFTFIGMRIAGITVNLMSLSGMVVALGMVVDGSIVMIEQVYRHYSAKDSDGKPLYGVEQSIFAGSAEVGASVFASTATTVVVFVPIAALSGIVGMVLRDVALTLIMALTASFISAIVVVPFLMRLLLKKEGPSLRKPSFVNRGMAKLERRYRRMLEWSLSSWKFILFVSLCVLFVTLFIARTLGIAFVPSTDNSDFYINVHFPDGYSLEKTHERMLEINRLLRRHVPEVQSAVFYSGQSESFGGDVGGSSNAGYAHVVLVPVAERTRDVHDIILLMQDIVSSQIPDITVTVSNGGFDKLLGYVSGGGGFGLTLASENMTELYGAASRIADFLRTDPDVVSVSLDTSFDTETLVMDMVHEYMSSLGVSSYEAGITAAVLFQGMDAGRFRNREDGERYDIRLFSDITDAPVTADRISDVRIVSSSGIPVSFANIALIRTERAVSQINHTDRAKTITVSASLVDEDTAGVNGRVRSYLESNPLPPDVKSKTGGIMELIGDALPSMFTALAVAWFLVYTVMVLQFERFRQPFIVMATIPFCLIGVVLGLLMFGSTMSLLALLGVIALGGVVVNNGIILIDYINLLRERKSGAASEAQNAGAADPVRELRESVVEGASSRLRPIFMTTLTTMLGVVPMAVATGEGAEIYAPLGQAIAGGLLTSTLITLFLIPVLYFITERRKIRKTLKTRTSRTQRRRKSATLPAILAVSTVFTVCTPHASAAPGMPVTVPGLETPLPAAAPLTSDVRSADGGYTFEQLASVLEEHNATLSQARESYARALLDVRDARAGFWPTVDFALGGSYMANPMIGEMKASAGSLGVIPPLSPGMQPIPLPAKDFVVFEGMPNLLYSFQLDIRQPVFTWGKLPNAVKLYEAAAEVRRLQLSAGNKQLRAELEAKLGALHYLGMITELLRTQHDYASRLVRLSEEAERQGALLKQEVLEARMQATLVSVTQAEIENQRNTLLLEVRRLTGLETLEFSDIDFRPDESAYVQIAAIPRAELERAALDSGQESLAILDKLYEAASYARKIAEGSVYWKPDVALTVSVGFNGSMEKLFTGRSSAEKDLVANVSLGLKTTVWDGGKKLNDIKRQQSNLVSADIDRGDARAAIRQQLHTQCNTMELARLRIEYFTLKTATAESEVDRAEQLSASGYGAERDVLKARVDTVTEQINLLREKINFTAAVCTVRVLTRL